MRRANLAAWGMVALIPFLAFAETPTDGPAKTGSEHLSTAANASAGEPVATDAAAVPLRAPVAPPATADTGPDATLPGTPSKTGAAGADAIAARVAGDTVDLETTAIKGAQELPRVLYIVPWKKALPAEVAGRPANSLLDEALAPVDREVFVRRLDYYDQVRSGPETDSLKTD